MTSKILTVPSSAIPALRKAYSRIIRAAKRIGVELSEDGFKIDWTTKREVKKTRLVVLKTEDGEQTQPAETFIVEVVDVTLELPEIGNTTGKWTVAGIVNRVNHEGDKADSRIGENEVFSKEQSVIDIYRKTPLTCAHCGTNRYRVKTIVCREVATGNLLQLGLECAVHYVGDAEKEVAALEFQELVVSLVSAFEEDAGDRERGWSSHALRAYDSEDVIAQTVCIIRLTGGYQPSRFPLRDGDYGEAQRNPNATWITVLKRLDDTRFAPVINPADIARMDELTLALKSDTLTTVQREHLNVLRYDLIEKLGDLQSREKVWLANQPTAEDRAEAATVLAWITSVEPKADDKFLIDLKSCFSPGWVSNKKVAFAACVTRAYARAQQVAQDLANPPTAPAPEGRVQVTGTVISFKEVTNDFGTTTKMLVKLTTGSKVYCSIPTGAKTDVGQTIRFVATFTRSDRDQFFAFGKIPKLPSPPKVKKAKKVKAETAELLIA